MSHSLIVLSSEPEARRRPSGLNATELTQPVWPVKGAHRLSLAEPNLSRIPCGHKQDRYGRADREALLRAYCTSRGLPFLPLPGAGPPLRRAGAEEGHPSTQILAPPPPPT